MSRSLIAVFAFSVAAVFIAPELSAQQRVAGRVLEDSSRRPIPDVALVLVDGSGFTVGRATRSDSLGKFVLNAPTEGRFHIRATRIGFQPAQSPAVQLQRGFEVPIELEMSSVPQRLAVLTITGRNIPISRSLDEFEHRRKTENGFFMTKDEIAKRNPVDVLAIFRDAPGMRVRDNGDGTSSLFFMRAPTPGLRSNADGQVVQENIVCPPVVYVDGMRMSTNSAHSGPAEYLRTLRPEDIFGVELYSGVSRVPTQFAGSDAQCGVVVVWTRRSGG